MALAALALLAAAAFSGSASAATGFDVAGEAGLTLDDDAHFFPAAAPVTLDGYQYSGYWDAEDPRTGLVYLKITRRRLSDNNLVSLRFDQSGDHLEYLEWPKDAHNGVGLGVSKADGRLHISWSLHKRGDHVIRYLISNAGCTSQTQANFNFSNCRFTFSNTQADSTLETSMTYPTYFNDNDGNLYFYYRWDSSPRGDGILNVYNNDGTWTTRGRILRGHSDGTSRYDYTYDPDGAGPLPSETSVERGVYPAGFKFDTENNLHMFWMWREHASAGHHGLEYAWSDDLGRTWKDTNGTTIATSGSDPITILDTTAEVVSEPPGYNIGVTGFDVDSNNQPHFVAPVSDTQSVDPLNYNNRLAHWWRTADGTWRAGYIESSGDATQSPTVGSLMFDRADNAYYWSARNRPFGWAPYNSDIFVQGDLPLYRVTWQDGEYMDIQIYSGTTCLDASQRLAQAISTAGYNQVRMRLRNASANTGVTVWWQTAQDPSWGTKYQEFNGVFPRNDTNYRDYTFRITNSQWRDTLRTMELCFSGGATSGAISVDSIAVTDSSGRAALSWDFREGSKLYVAEASAADNWASWQINPLLPDVSVAFYDDGTYRPDRKRYLDSGKVNFNLLVQGAPGNEILTTREFDIIGDDTMKYWRFDADAQAWRVDANVRGFGWQNDSGTKGIAGTATATAGGILSNPSLKLPIDGNADYVHVNMKNSAGTRGRVCFITSSDPRWTGSKCASFSPRAGTGYQRYDIDMSGVSGWNSSRSTVDQILVYPVDDSSSGTFNIDSVRIDDSAT